MTTNAVGSSFGVEEISSFEEEKDEDVGVLTKPTLTPEMQEESKRTREVVRDLIQRGTDLADTLAEEIEKDEPDSDKINTNMQKCLTMLYFLYERYARVISEKDKKRIEELKKKATSATEDKSEELLKKGNVAFYQGIATLALTLTGAVQLVKSDRDFFQFLSQTTQTAKEYVSTKYDSEINKLDTEINIKRSEFETKAQKTMQDQGKQQIRDVVDAFRQYLRKAASLT